jgi:hypothetical protein
MATAAEILAAIDTCILNILTNGQDTTFQNRRWVQADLNTLQTMRKYYEAQAGSSSTSNIFDRTLTGVPYRGA